MRKKLKQQYGSGQTATTPASTGGEESETQKAEAARKEYWQEAVKRMKLVEEAKGILELENGQPRGIGRPEGNADEQLKATAPIEINITNQDGSQVIKKLEVEMALIKKTIPASVGGSPVNIA